MLFSIQIFNQFLDFFLKQVYVISVECFVEVKKYNQERRPVCIDRL